VTFVVKRKGLEAIEVINYLRPLIGKGKRLGNFTPALSWMSTTVVFTHAGAFTVQTLSVPARGSTFLLLPI